MCRWLSAQEQTMTEFRKHTLRNFEAFCCEMSVPTDEYKIGLTLLNSEIDDFEQNECTYGYAKTRRPSMDHKYFSNIISQIKEIKRREREDVDGLFQ
jgi:hypothetical protein